MNESVLEKMASMIGFHLRKPKQKGTLLNSGGTIIRTPPKMRELEIDRDGRIVVLTGKSLRRHRIKQNRIAREEAKAKA